MTSPHHPAPCPGAVPDPRPDTAWVRCALASRRGRPPELARGQLLHLPAGVLFEPMVVAALGSAVTQTRPPARLVWDVVFEISLRGRPAAGRPGARRVPDLGQMPQLDPGIMPSCREPVVAVLGGDRVQRDDQVPLPGGPGRQPPAAVSARRSGPAGGGEREPGPSLAAGFRPGRLVPALGPGASVADGVSLLVGYGHAPGRSGVARGRAGQVPGQPRVDRPDPGHLAGPVRPARQGGQRDGQGDPAREPGRDQAGPRARPESARLSPAGLRRRLRLPDRLRRRTFCIGLAVRAFPACWPGLESWPRRRSR